MKCLISPFMVHLLVMACEVISVANRRAGKSISFLPLPHTRDVNGVVTGVEFPNVLENLLGGRGFERPWCMPHCILQGA
jgi:hypothetical protein